MTDNKGNAVKDITQSSDSETIIYRFKIGPLPIALKISQKAIMNLRRGFTLIKNNSSRINIYPKA